MSLVDSKRQEERTQALRNSAKPKEEGRCNCKRRWSSSRNIQNFLFSFQPPTRWWWWSSFFFIYFVPPCRALFALLRVFTLFDFFFVFVRSPSYSQPALIVSGVADVSADPTTASFFPFRSPPLFAWTFFSLFLLLAHGQMCTRRHRHTCRQNSYPYELSRSKAAPHMGILARAPILRISCVSLCVYVPTCCHPLFSYHMITTLLFFLLHLRLSWIQEHCTRISYSCVALAVLVSRVSKMAYTRWNQLWQYEIKRHGK